VRPASIALGVATVATLVLAGCGPKPPQPPTGQDKAIDDSLSAFASRCGYAEEVTAFPGGNGELAVLDRRARSKAGGFLKALRAHPNWIYQGRTLLAIGLEAAPQLRNCGLVKTANAISAATGSP
jgi:hypothetical protein